MKLTTKQRQEMPKEDFVFPDTLKYPIHDKQHAVQALRFSAKRPEADVVRKAVHERYPDMVIAKLKDQTGGIAKVASTAAVRYFAKRGGNSALFKAMDSTMDAMKSAKSVAPTQVANLKTLQNMKGRAAGRMAHTQDAATSMFAQAKDRAYGAKAVAKKVSSQPVGRVKVDMDSPKMIHTVLSQQPSIAVRKASAKNMGLI